MRETNMKERPNDDLEFNKGGGGGEGKSFFSFKSNTYSRQCYNDPENPGKLICKEIRDTSGYDPFNKEKNYRNRNENVYTQDPYGNKENGDKGLFDTM
jgi:hypothetical protein